MAARSRLLGALVGLVLVLAGCGDASGDRATVSSTPRDEAVDEVSPSVHGGPVLTQAAAEAALLTAEELPELWNLAPPAEEPAEEVDPVPVECDVMVRAILGDAQGVVQAMADFQAEIFGPFMSQIVASYGEGAVHQLERLEAAINDCAAFSSTHPEDTGPFSVSRLELPNLGDRTLALRLEGFGIGEAPAALDLVMVASGQEAVLLLGFSLVALPVAELEAFATRAVEKLASAR